MIKINGITFRNLEEQVKYLSEMIPLFEMDNGELVIKQGDGTEIARLNLNSVADLDISTSNDITTITKTMPDGTTTTYTIDMSIFLKKQTYSTTVMQAYIKGETGNQTMIDVHWNNVRDTIPIRDQTGNIRVSLIPTTTSHATSKQYVDDAISNINVKRYNHFIEMSFVDGCANELKGFVAIETNNSTPFTVSTFKGLFSKEITTNYGQSIWKVIPYVSSQFFEKQGNDRPLPCMYYYYEVYDEFHNNTYTDSGYSSSLTLALLTDTVQEV